jgi:4-hydroxyphenylpyruvate dioxygenase-like putative hemolysin
MVDVLEIDRVVIASGDMEETVEQFERLGLSFGEGMSFQLGEEALSGRMDYSGVDIISPASDGEIARFVEEEGPGLYGISLRVSDAEAARQHLAEEGIEPFQQYQEGEFLEFFYHPRHFSGVMVIVAEYPATHPLEAFVTAERRGSDAAE